MCKIPTWLSTVGWSPFAVINPIWAYCKESINYPEKVILFYTNREQIKKNFLKCKSGIFKILQTYHNGSFYEENIIGCPLENETFDCYAETIRDTILNEKALRPDSIILDMTPGRKYMSALMMIYGQQLNSKEVPIDVYYLHLEDDSYLNLPYQLIPNKLNNFMNIFEYSSIFEELKLKLELTEKEDKFFENLQEQLLNDKWQLLKNDDDKCKFLFLCSILIGHTDKYRIIGLFREKEIELDNADFNRLLTLYKAYNYLYEDGQKYYLKDEGRSELDSLNLQINTGDE